MGNFKVNRDFSSGRYSDAELSVKASHVVEQMTGNVHFPEPVPPLVAITSANVLYILSLNNAENGSREYTVIKNNNRKIIESLLKQETDYVQQASSGEEAIIFSSGFEVNKKPSVIGPLLKAIGLTVNAGSNKGTVVLNCNVVANALSAELVHGIMGTACFQCSLSGKIFLMVITDVRTRHILVPDTGYALTDFLTLYSQNIAKHSRIAKIFLGEIVGRQGGGVIGRQCDQVMEDPRTFGTVGLERADAFIGLFCQFCTVILHAHQISAVIFGNVKTFSLHRVINLLTEIKRPVE